MKDIFSTAGLETLRHFITPHTLIAFDLDGTLAPISPDPGNITVSNELQHELQMIMQYLPVAIITGRSRRDALRFFEISPNYLIGNHGAEGLPRWEQAETLFNELGQSWKMQLLHCLETSDAGVLLEDKGTSLSVHYRHTVNRDQAYHRLLHMLKKLTPTPRIVEGKCVINLVPFNAPHKGDALLELLHLAGMNSAIFMGDDETDEDIFALKQNHILSIRVGKSTTSQADWFIPEQNDLLKIVIEMRLHLQRTQSAKNQEM
ncbi:MAG: trehalose-phosphatase [Trichlorobacter sp.]|uniref:trehalose-phosphatase n=1 Tax=Trichlorobacter sp. TaxID=2911007 RepID=UPI00256428AE|nr:trehalose-phosphatase [Trichlorobacter sp.]MDK9718172.1 trehalose-phosphatase [Trichlorobacter sp.]